MHLFCLLRLEHEFSAVEQLYNTGDSYCCKVSDNTQIKYYKQNILKVSKKKSTYCAVKWFQSVFYFLYI